IQTCLLVSWFVALAAGGLAACGGESGGSGPVSVCQCRPDQVCVNNTCMSPRGALDDVPAPDAGACEPSDVRINEVRVSSDTRPDFIELIGTPEAPLDGFLLLATDANGQARTSVRLTGTIGTDGLWLGAFGDGLEVTPDAIVGLL